MGIWSVSKLFQLAFLLCQTLIDINAAAVLEDSHNGSGRGLAGTWEWNSGNGKLAREHIELAPPYRNINEDYSSIGTDPKTKKELKNKLKSSVRAKASHGRHKSYRKKNPKASGKSVAPSNKYSIKESKKIHANIGSAAALNSTRILICKDICASKILGIGAEKSNLSNPANASENEEPRRNYDTMRFKIIIKAPTSNSSEAPSTKGISMTPNVQSSSDSYQNSEKYLDNNILIPLKYPSDKMNPFEIPSGSLNPTTAPILESYNTPIIPSYLNIQNNLEEHALTTMDAHQAFDASNENLTKNLGAKVIPILESYMKSIRKGCFDKIFGNYMCSTLKLESLEEMTTESFEAALTASYEPIFENIPKEELQESFALAILTTSRNISFVSRAGENSTIATDFINIANSTSAKGYNFTSTYLKHINASTPPSIKSATNPTELTNTSNSISAKHKHDPFPKKMPSISTHNIRNMSFIGASIRQLSSMNSLIWNQLPENYSKIFKRSKNAVVVFYLTVLAVLLSSAMGIFVLVRFGSNRFRRGRRDRDINMPLLRSNYSESNKSEAEESADNEIEDMNALPPGHSYSKVILSKWPSGSRLSLKPLIAINKIDPKEDFFTTECTPVWTPDNLFKASQAPLLDFVSDPQLISEAELEQNQNLSVQKFRFYLSDFIEGIIDRFENYETKDEIYRRSASKLLVEPTALPPLVQIPHSHSASSCKGVSWNLPEKSPETSYSQTRHLSTFKTPPRTLFQDALETINAKYNADCLSSATHTVELNDSVRCYSGREPQSIFFDSYIPEPCLHSKTTEANWNQGCFQSLDPESSFSPLKLRNPANRNHFYSNRIAKRCRYAASTRLGNIKRLSKNLIKGRKLRLSRTGLVDTTDHMKPGLSKNSKDSKEKRPGSEKLAARDTSRVSSLNDEPYTIFQGREAMFDSFIDLINSSSVISESKHSQMIAKDQT